MIALGAGLLLGATLVPIVKSIWTPSWVIFSSGWALLFFGLFYHVVELHERRRWALPLVIAGLNPIVLYVFGRYYRYWIAAVWNKPTGGALLAGPWGPVVEAAVILISLWVLAYVLYRARIFVRV
jgi:heparan-alpha-glucosaminide N-acetyltransferase